MSSLDSLSLRVVPFDVGLHHGLMSGPFVMMRFPTNGEGREMEPPTVYVEGFTGALYLDKPHEFECYGGAFESIWGSALDEVGSEGAKQVKSSDLTGAVWRKSSYSNGQAACVEVAFLGNGRVAVRDSKDQGNGDAVVFTAGEWRAFSAGMEDGEFKQS